MFLCIKFNVLVSVAHSLQNRHEQLFDNQIVSSLVSFHSVFRKRSFGKAMLSLVFFAMFFVQKFQHTGAQGK